MPYFTVFTPTYNRAYILPKLYHSLREQTCKDFEWMIVDDGSTDDTGKLVAQWEEQNNGFDIRYCKVSNGGKPRAINFGIAKASGEFFFMVDSDDRLTTDAVQKMLLWCKEIEDDPTFVGVGAARGYPDGSYLKGTAPRTNEHGYVDATNLDRNNLIWTQICARPIRSLFFSGFPWQSGPEKSLLRSRLHSTRSP